MTALNQNHFQINPYSIRNMYYFYQILTASNKVKTEFVGRRVQPPTRSGSVPEVVQTWHNLQTCTSSTKPPTYWQKFVPLTNTSWRLCQVCTTSTSLHTEVYVRVCTTLPTDKVKSICQVWWYRLVGGGHFYQILTAFNMVKSMSEFVILPSTKYWPYLYQLTASKVKRLSVFFYQILTASNKVKIMVSTM